jgi:hypothetical protein
MNFDSRETLPAMWRNIVHLPKEANVGNASAGLKGTRIYVRERRAERRLKFAFLISVRLFHLMKRMYLDQLAMAGGEVRAILNRIRTAGLQRFYKKTGWNERRYLVQSGDPCIDPLTINDPSFF